jgi:parallel beta-helix repeat protein
MASKKAIPVLLIPILLMGSLTLLLELPSAYSIEPIIRIVPQDYATIQAAIDASSPGDTILVKAGTYYENITINKTVSLAGEDVTNTIIDGGGVTILASNVQVSGLTIRNAGEGIVLVGEYLSYNYTSLITNCSISQNHITNVTYGIDIQEHSSGNYVTMNQIDASYMGICIHSGAYLREDLLSSATTDNNTIYGNVIHGKSEGSGIYSDGGLGNNISANEISNFSIGISLEVGNPSVYISSQNTISNNRIVNNTYGIEVYGADFNSIIENEISSNSLAGILLTGVDQRQYGQYFSENNVIYANNITASGDGIRFEAASLNTIEKNHITNNAFGISLDVVEDHFYDPPMYWSSHSNTIIENDVIGNQAGIEFRNSSGNSIYHNKIIRNLLQIHTTNSTNTWDNGYPSGGNYWSDYIGLDGNGDGVGDKPYVIDSNNRDHYPLMGAQVASTFTDEFNASTLDSRWTVIDPNGDSTFDLTSMPGYLTISTTYPPNRDLWPRVNLYSPRIMQPVDGNFSVETKLSAVFNESVQSGGIVVWKDENNYLRLERAYRYGYQEIIFNGMIEGIWSTMGPETVDPGALIHVPNINPTYLRLTRGDKTYRGYYSTDGLNWIFLANITMKTDYSVTAGLYNVLRGDSEFNATASTISFDYFRVGAFEDQPIENEPSHYSLSLRILDWSGDILPSCGVAVSNVGGMLSDAQGWVRFKDIINGTYLVTTNWQGSTVNQTSITLEGSNVTFYVRAQVYRLSLANSFRDASGNKLYAYPSIIKLTFPNGTTSTSLVPSIGFLVQGGNTKLSSITWQGSEVTPDTSFDAANGNPLIDCRVYSSTVDPVFYDNTGTTLVKPSTWTIRFPNGTARTVSQPVAYNQTQTGDYSMVSVIWNDVEVIPSNPTATLTSDMLWSPRLNCRLPTDIHVSLGASTSYVGFKVEIDGTLTCNGKAVSGAPVLLSYSVTGGSSWNDITLENTTVDGKYSAVWLPSATGSYLVRATYSGNSTYPSSNALINLAMTASESQVVFSVKTNSTVSHLSFNSTTNELAFTVSGPSNTSGYVEVYVAKSLIQNILDVKVYLDGNRLDYTSTSLDDSWLLQFSYRHSTHAVAIAFGVSPIKIVGIVLISAVLAISMVIAIIMIRKRSRNRAVRRRI